MNILLAIVFPLIFLLTSCVTSKSQIAKALDSKPEKVTLCQIQADPAAYNHKLVETTGFVSQGFENFTIFDPTCSTDSSVWLEYGGTSASGTMYCCGVTNNQNRSKPLIVEDIPVSLVEDKLFRKFDKLLEKSPDSLFHATIIGRFFSGERTETQIGVRWLGYGHMGCCSLLAIEQITAIAEQERMDLDYGATPDSPDLNGNCGYEFLKGIESSKEKIQIQQKAEANPTGISFNNPQQIAISALARVLSVEESSIKGFKEKRKAQGRFVYWWKPKSKESKYMVVVSRPYWLSFYAKDQKKVAWVVTAAYKTSCD